MIVCHGPQVSTNNFIWVGEILKVYSTPALIFEEGELLRRHNSLTFPHHFKESLRYVAGGYYTQTDYSSYSQRRTEELLEAGVTIDLGRPRVE